MELIITVTVCTPGGAHPASSLRDPLASLLWFSTSHFPFPVLGWNLKLYPFQASGTHVVLSQLSVIPL